MGRCGLLSEQLVVGSSVCALTWCFSLSSMNVGVAHSEVNPNTRVMNSRGIWLTYLLLTVVLHVILLSIPFFTVPLVWTLTNVIHNLVSYTWSSLKSPMSPRQPCLPGLWVDLFIPSWSFLQVMYLFLHTVKGTPFETPDQGKARLLTHWEQMDYGVQFTSSRKFLTISPIVLWVSHQVFTVTDQFHTTSSEAVSILRRYTDFPEQHCIMLCLFGVSLFNTVY